MVAVDKYTEPIMIIRETLEKKKLTYYSVGRPAVIFFIFFATMLSLSCKKPYDPNINAPQDHFLVVEGMLTDGGLTTITLSRTRPFNNTPRSDTVKPETKALVSIESENSKSTNFAEQGRGTYTMQLNLNSAEKYRLRIKTADGKEYLSKFVPVINTPPIDSILWRLVDKGLQIYVNTHDPQNKTRYYRWSFEETWTGPSIIPASNFEYINGLFVRRKVPTPSGVCYSTRIANPLLLSSTIKLADDVVYMAPVNLIQTGSVKLGGKYSILVKQYALEKNAYEYWAAIQKNTEQLGSIFDPQPSNIFGNIYSVTDPKETVIGYFGACTPTEKRIFITSSEAKWFINNDCDIFEEKNLNPDTLAVHFGKVAPALGREPIEEIRNLFGILQGYTAVNNGCLSCNGTFTKPVFWK